MKRIFAAMTAALLLVSLVGVSSVAAAGGGSKLNPPSCAGTLIINVNQKVVNDVDSGVAGFWAFINYSKSIHVYQLSDSTFCLSVNESGQFVTIAGTSPAGTGTVSAGVKGTFSGGYQAIVTGSLLSPLVEPIKGSLGTFDYQCDASGNCPGYSSWLDLYFTSGYSFDYAWWGWQYKAGSHGTYTPTITGSSGDITG
jgi:hypothetical protein